MLVQTDIHCTINLLTHMPCKTPPAFTASRRKLLHTLLFKTRSQFGFAAALLPVTLLSLAQLAMKSSVVLAVARREKVGNAHIDTDHRGSCLGLYGDYLVIGEREPPAVSPLVQGRAGVDGLTFERLTTIVCQLDWYLDGFTLLKRANSQPVVEGRILG